MSALSIELLSHLTWLVPTSVFVAGVVGSPHCVGMCGPLVMNFGRNGRSLIAYHIGRMITYTAAGAIAGTLGRAALGTVGVSTAGLLALSLLLMILAWRTFFKESRVHVGLPWGLDRMHLTLWKKLKSLPLPSFALSGAAGALTVFLPCLHLYGFLTGAAATGSTAGGAIFMFTFWLSTLPALSAAPLLLKRWLGGPRSGRVAAGLLLTAALISLSQFALNVNRHAASGETSSTSTAELKEPPHHHCH